MSYYYFISSLPHLAFDGKPSLSSDEFLESARQWVSAADLRALESSAAGSAVSTKNKIGARWKKHEETLRNLLAAARAAKLGKDQAPFLNKAGGADSQMRSAIQEAVKSDNPAKAEEILDRLRWAFLDEISAAHSFDFNVALSYLMKLKILERRAAFDEKTGKNILDKSIVAT